MIGGTDGGDNPKVVPLYTHQATAAGLPPQADVIAQLELLLQKAVIGEVTGLVYIALNPQGDYLNGTRGKIVYTAVVTALEEIKLGVIATNSQVKIQK